MLMNLLLYSLYVCYQSAVDSALVMFLSESLQCSRLNKAAQFDQWVEEVDYNSGGKK